MATRYKIGRRTLALLATVLGGVVVPATALAQAPIGPTACVALEALVGNQSGPSPGGEVIRVNPGGQSTVTTDTAPTGSPDLVAPYDMAYLPNGDIVIADSGLLTGSPKIVEVDPGTGVRTLVSGQATASSPARGAGPALVSPYWVAVAANGDILASDEVAATRMPRILRIDPVTGDRTVLSGNTALSGTALSVGPTSIAVVNGVIYVANAGHLMSVDPILGYRSLISGRTRGAGPTFSWDVSSITGSSTTNSLMLLDAGYLNGGGPYFGALFQVDLTSGDRTLFADNTTPTTGGAQFHAPRDMAYDGCNDAYYVVDDENFVAPPRILKVDGAGASNPGKRTLYTTFVGMVDYPILLTPILYLPGGGTGGGGGGDVGGIGHG